MVHNTPMLEQYWRLKEEHSDALLLYRLGDFYELFFSDAEVAAPLLDLQLTSRDGRVAMCGVPHHAVNGYVQKLLDHGHTVAIAEQMEDPKKTKGLVDRQIVRVYSPGTFIPDDADLLPRLAVLYRDRHGWSLVIAELSTGTIHVAEGRLGDKSLLEDAWARWHPDEYLTNWPVDEIALTGRAISPEPWFKGVAQQPVEKILAKKLGTVSLSSWGLADRPRAQKALYVLWGFLEANQRRDPGHLKQLRLYQLDQTLRVSWRTLMQLDVFQDKGPNLYAVLNQTVTPLGSRELRQWLEHPSTDRILLNRRNEAISRLMNDPALRADLRSGLKPMGDLTRRVSRVVMGTASPRDLGGIRTALVHLPALVRVLDATPTPIWPTDILHQANLDKIRQTLSGLANELPLRWEDDDIIGPGVSSELDRYRALVNHQREALADLEAHERERSQIRTLKLGYHRSFGYYLEVSRARAKEVPDDWQRRQTMTHTERYSSEPLRALEAEIFHAQSEARKLEEEIIAQITKAVVEGADIIGQVGSVLAELDVLAALAEVSVARRYVSPEFVETADGAIDVRDMRHPILETVVHDYVPSDCFLPSPIQTAIITGPNMGGKSTFMRALALNVLLAQIGCMVPATRFSIPLFDGLYARIGADDDIFRGQSTFMVEMEEVSAILRHATPQSLVLLDELGRGTSTYDGLAIAWAVLEQLALNRGPTTLFATHYHELTELAERNPHVTNLTVEVVEDKPGRILFTHRVIPGQASRSYGVDVARLAGFPPLVISRAERHLKEWERMQDRPRRQEIEQVTLFAPDPVCEEMRQAFSEVNPDELSPREAWDWVASWHERLNRRRDP